MHDSLNLYCPDIKVGPEFKVDLHVHTDSHDSHDMSPVAVIETAIGKGINALAATNHDSVESSIPTVEHARRAGFPVFAGVEISSDIGHILVYGLSNDGWKRHLHGKSTLPIAERLIPALREEHGDSIAIFWAHPFQSATMVNHARLHALLTVFDGLESINGLKFHANKILRQKLEGVEYKGIGGSDAHCPAAVGDAYTAFSRPVYSDGELVAALRGGGYRAVMGRALHPFYL